MSIFKAYCVALIVVMARGAGLYDVVFTISLHQTFPKLIFGDCANVEPCVRSAIESLKGHSWVTTYEMFVVAVVFGEGFFENRAVNGRVF